MEKRVKTIEQVKAFSIKAYSSNSSKDYGNETIVWANDQIWNSDEECMQLLKDAKKDLDQRRKEFCCVTDNEPVLSVYWLDPTGEIWEEEIYEKKL